MKVLRQDKEGIDKKKDEIDKKNKNRFTLPIDVQEEKSDHEEKSHAQDDEDMKVEKSLKLNHNGEKAKKFVDALFLFVSKKNGYCGFAKNGGIEFKSNQKLIDFRNSFSEGDKKSLKLGTTFKAFERKLDIY
ncbi:hypothetical protein MKW92_050529, partial [Papaver armeniacum]